MDVHLDLFPFLVPAELSINIVALLNHFILFLLKFIQRPFCGMTEFRFFLLGFFLFGLFVIILILVVIEYLYILPWNLTILWQAFEHIVVQLNIFVKRIISLQFNIGFYNFSSSYFKVFYIWKLVSSFYDNKSQFTHCFRQLIHEILVVNINTDCMPSVMFLNTFSCENSY